MTRRGASCSHVFLAWIRRKRAAKASGDSYSTPSVHRTAISQPALIASASRVDLPIPAMLGNLRSNDRLTTIS
jgi:hypothetical protein